jgi:hypothetical protein
MACLCDNQNAMIDEVVGMAIEHQVDKLLQNENLRLSTSGKDVCYIMGHQGSCIVINKNYMVPQPGICSVTRLPINTLNGKYVHPDTGLDFSDEEMTAW